MNCLQAREVISDSNPSAERLAALQIHLETCPGCSETKHRFELYREAARGHHADIAPDSNFSSRVMAGLPQARDPFEIMSWAALRTLPACLALVLVLATWLALPPAGGADSYAKRGLPLLSSDDAMILWLLRPPEEL